jgi:murein DD-endopeptidase MepM/ murein hydrolase activator NlpD
MSADGSGVRRVTTRSGADRNPDWRGHRTAEFQPDLAIAESGSTEFVGNAIYGPGQTLSTLIAPGSSKTFAVRVTNDGDAADSFSIQGSAGGAGARVAYRAQGRDVTRAVTSGTYAVESIAPGKRSTLELIVSLEADVQWDTRLTIRMQAGSGADPARRDGVALQVRPARIDAYSYGWPLRPFFAQHPIRGMFGDPRIAPRVDGPPGQSFHFGVDLPAAGGTPVYAATTGFVFMTAGHRHVTVRHADGSMLLYWHLVPAVYQGQLAVAQRTIVGYIDRDREHVHLAESRGGKVVNPLRPGAMGPYVDDTQPVIVNLRFERSARRVRSPLRGTVDIVAEGQDRPPVALSPPRDGAVYAPALVRWRIVSASGRTVRPWATVFDVRRRLPTEPFGTIFAPGTDQNRPNRPGRYRFYLARRWPSTGVRDGEYVIGVRLADIRGNTTTHREPLTVRTEGASGRHSPMSRESSSSAPPRATGSHSGRNDSAYASS